MGAGGGGSWKVAFADFMTAMFALFLLLWLVSLSPEKKEGIESYFKTYTIFKNLAGVMPGHTSVMPNYPKEEKKTNNPDSAATPLANTTQSSPFSSDASFS